MKLFKSKDIDATEIWKKYEQGVDWHNKHNMYSNTEKYYNFFEGDQWHGIESGDETLPMYNFIQPVCEYKIAMVAMNLMTINYSPLNTGQNQKVFQQACDLLNQKASSVWELKKMDSKSWETVKQACIGGDAYLFFYNSQLDAQHIDRTNIYLSDEQNSDIQKQKHIIIYERRFVEDVKEDARANKIPEDQIDTITGDDDTDNLPEAAKQEVKTGEKCSCLLYLCKKKLNPPNVNEYGIYVARSTQTVIYQPETLIDGLTLYPIANLLWSTKRGSARGIGEVQPLVNNQISTNKLLARREMNLKMTGFPKPVYNTEMVSNPQDVDKIGTSIKIQGNVNKIEEAFRYVSPMAMSRDAPDMQQELITTSRDLASAGDNATGNINPEKASGAAIIAVKDQQAIASTQTTSAYKQFIEDIAAIWLDMWIAYNPNGLTIDLEQDGETVQEQIPAEILKELQVNIRIDVSPTNPFSKFAREQALENAMEQNRITFDEYVSALDDDSTAPKGKFEDIIEQRKVAEQNQLEQAVGIIEQQKQLISQLQGGGQNAMSAMQ